MNLPALEKIAKDLVAPGKGILAADESLGTIEKRFKAIGLESTRQTRKAYREMLFTTPGIEEFISGIIQFDETLRGGILKNPKIASGIKVDEGTQDLPNHPGEKITKGIEGLGKRLKEYKKLGAKFTKWRAVFSISNSTPSTDAVVENGNLLGEFARISQENDFVPIVEPEVLMESDHSIDKCAGITRAVLKVVFLKLKEKNVSLSAILLKPNMILPGEDNPAKATPDEIAQKTIEVLKEAVPPEVPGIVFLSGGQSESQATDNLRKINIIDNVSWQLSFSFGRALQNSALKIWSGKKENIESAQDAFYNRARMNSLARYGK